MRKKILFTLGALAMCAGLAMSIPNTAYAANEVAVASTISSEYTGWVENDNGTMSYYQDGEMIINQIIQIGSDYYGFDDYGIMYQDCEFIIDDNGPYNTKYYRASETGQLYNNQWYEDIDSSERYYYTADCSGAIDIVQVDNIGYL